MKQYCWNVLVGLDQFCNCLFGGSPDETMSSRIGRYYHEKPDSLGSRLGLYLNHLVGGFLNLIQKRHIQNSLEPPDHHQRDVLK